jgi:LmbE family N-acetylglucosaminyl deacetylase
MRDARAAGFRSRAEYAHTRRAELLSALSYANAGFVREELGLVDQEVTFELEPLTQRLAAFFYQASPTCVLTHAYEGGHPDHDAVALAVHAAVQLLRRSRNRAPAIIEMTSYHAGSRGIETGTFLPAALGATTVRLSQRERSLKRSMLSCFATQRHVLAYFNTECELFRDAPLYRFIDPPHRGRLFYEHFDWGVDGTAWRKHAAQALSALDLDPAECH